MRVPARPARASPSAAADVISASPPVPWAKASEASKISQLQKYAQVLLLSNEVMFVD